MSLLVWVAGCHWSKCRGILVRSDQKDTYYPGLIRWACAR